MTARPGSSLDHDPIFHAAYRTSVYIHRMGRHRLGRRSIFTRSAGLEITAAPLWEYTWPSSEHTRCRKGIHCIHVLTHTLTFPFVKQIRIAIVAYGRSDTLPSPILCKRYFDSLNELKPRFPHGLVAFGVSNLSAGGSQGMAALDGLVAALEV